MKIGFSVEGSTDRALLSGLQARWCPDAELLQGHFRGQTQQSQRREIPNTCIELLSKDAAVIIFMRDANNENWREVLQADSKRCKPDHQHLTIFAVCDRNVECWICADADWIKQKTSSHDDLSPADPKNIFQRALQITRDDPKESAIAELVKQAPLDRWLRNKSFEDFYEKVREKSKELGCQIENLRTKAGG